MKTILLLLVLVVLLVSCAPAYPSSSGTPSGKVELFARQGSIEIWKITSTGQINMDVCFLAINTYTSGVLALSCK